MDTIKTLSGLALGAETLAMMQSNTMFSITTVFAVGAVMVVLMFIVFRALFQQFQNDYD